MSEYASEWVVCGFCVAVRLFGEKSFDGEKDWFVRSVSDPVCMCMRENMRKRCCGAAGGNNSSIHYNRRRECKQQSETEMAIRLTMQSLVADGGKSRPCMCVPDDPDDERTQWRKRSDEDGEDEDDGQGR